jgi:uncharacterized protein YraI
MKRVNFALMAAATAMATLPAIASATTASAVTDLNIRSGPGSQYEVLGVIDGGANAEVDGCMDGQSWCKVNYEGTSGWAYAPYLAVNVDNQAYVLPERPSTVEISTVTYENTEETTEDQRVGAAAGATIGTLAAYAAGGPVGGVIAGGILGGAAGAAAVEPTTESITYIESNPVEPVYLEGEVAVGAGVPTEVTTYELPENNLRYANVNGQTVVIDAETSAIVKVIR